MLPGSFVERTRACGRPNCHCADGKRLHSQFQISVLIDGKSKALNIPAELVDKVRQKIEMRRRLRCRRRHHLQAQPEAFSKKRKTTHFDPAPVRDLSRQGV
jgi:hypothetical protein